jgi:hypothetical protein
MEKEEVELSRVLEEILENVMIEDSVETTVSNTYLAYSNTYEGTPSELAIESRKYLIQQLDQMLLKARRLTPEDDYIKDRYKFMLTEGTFFTIGLAY